MKKVFFFAISCFSLGLYAQTDAIEQVELSDVVVSATRANRRTPTTFTNLTALEVNRLMVMPEIPSAIGLSASVVMTSENGVAVGNQTFRIRGSDATRINVTFDGVPVNDGESQAVFWANMPDLMSSLQTMQIQRGVGTSTNGAAAFGATLNMQSLQSAVKPYGQASAAYGSYETSKMNFAVGSGRTKNGWNVDLRYSRAQTAGYIDNGNVDQQSFFITGGYANSQRIVKMNFFHGNQKTGITWEGVPENRMKGDRRFNPSGRYPVAPGDTVRHDNETDNYYQTHFHLHYTEQLSERLRFSSTLFYTRGKGYYEQYRHRDYLERYVADSDPDHRFSLIRRRNLENDLSGLIATATYTTNKIIASMGISGSIYNNWHSGNIIWQQIQEVPDNFQWHRNIGVKTDLSGFIKASYQFADRWYAFGDLQLRRITYKIEGFDNDMSQQHTYLSNDHNYNFFNPKAGITFVITPQQRSYASFAIGNREPSRADIKDSFKEGGRDMPRPETLYNVEAGYELNSEIWTAGANFFYMLYKDQLVNTGKRSESGYALMENVKDSYRAGIELIFGVRPSQALHINGNITYSQNKIKNYMAYLDVRNPAKYREILGQRTEEPVAISDIAYSPEWIGAADISYEIISGLFFSLNAKYVGSQYFDNTSSADRRLDAYFVGNAIMQYQYDFAKNYYIGIQFAINNLWSAEYISNAAVYREYVGDDYFVYRSFFPQPPRNFMVKVTVGFN